MRRSHSHHTFLYGIYFEGFDFFVVHKTAFTRDSTKKFVAVWIKYQTARDFVVHH